MVVRLPSSPKGHAPESESWPRWARSFGWVARAKWFARAKFVFKLVAIPVAISLAMILPEHIVKLGYFTTGLMILNDEEKTEILRKVFRKCSDQNWAECDDYSPERWSQEALIYLVDAEDLFNRRNGGKLQKSIAIIFRPSFIRTSFYETLTGDVKKCVSRMETEISRIRQTGEIFYEQFLSVYNVSYAGSCKFLVDAFMQSVVRNELGSQQVTALYRRLNTIESLTEAVGFPADSTIPIIRARLAAISRETLDGLTDVCSIDIASRNRKLSSDVGTIRSALYGVASNNKTSIRELNHSEEEAARAVVKNILLVSISLLLLSLNARKLGPDFDKLWVTAGPHG